MYAIGRKESKPNLSCVFSSDDYRIIRKHLTSDYGEILFRLWLKERFMYTSPPKPEPHMLLVLRPGPTNLAIQLIEHTIYTMNTMITED